MKRNYFATCLFVRAAFFSAIVLIITAMVSRAHAADCGQTMVDACANFIKDGASYSTDPPCRAQENGGTCTNCANMTQACWEKAGVQLAGAADSQYEQCENEGGLFTDISQLRPGDLIFWDNGSTDNYPVSNDRNCVSNGANCAYMANHVNFYAGGGNIRNAGSASTGVYTQSLESYRAALESGGGKITGFCRPSAFKSRGGGGVGTGGGGVDETCEAVPITGGGDYGSTVDVECPTLDISGMSAGLTSGLYNPNNSGTSGSGTDIRKELDDAMKVGEERANNTAKEQINKAPPTDIMNGKGYCIGNMVSYFNAINMITSMTNMIQGMMQSILSQLSSGICNYVQAGVNNMLSGLCITMPSLPMPNLGISAPTLEGCNSGVPLLTMSAGQSLPVPDVSGYFKDLNSSILNGLGKNSSISLFK